MKKKVYSWKYRWPWFNFFLCAFSWNPPNVTQLVTLSWRGGGHTGLRSQTLSGKLKLTFVMSDLIFWCRTVFNMKDQVAQKLLVHYSSSSWEIFVPLLTNIYGWSWCVIGRLLTFKLRVKWISRSNQLSKCTAWCIIFNKFLEQAGAELCQAQYEIGDLNMISPLSLMYPAFRAQCAPPTHTYTQIIIWCVM